MSRWRPRGEGLFAARESRFRRWALAPLALLEVPYRGAARLHRQLYARGWLRRERLPAVVVSVGNLTVGGSAKTPTCAWLAGRLSRAGWRVALLSRGYRAPRAGPWAVVSSGASVHEGAERLGDEPLWLARNVPEVPVLAGADRAGAGRHAIETFGSELLLLDDGFQHHRLARDLDLVCVDGRLGLGNGRVLPRGPLREPASALAMADAIVLTRTPESAGGIALPGVASGPRFALPLAPVALRPLDPGCSPPRALEALEGARVGLLAAVARPQTLRESLGRLGAKLAAERLFADHHPYRCADLEGLDPRLDWITTGKDAVKLRPEWARAAGVRVWILDEAVPEGAGEALVAWLTRQIRAKFQGLRV